MTGQKLAERPEAAVRNGDGGVRSAARTVDVIGLLLRAPQGKHLRELSAELGTTTVTVWRVLQTLIAAGLVRKVAARGRYRMSSLFWLSLAAAFPDVRGLQSDFRGVLRELAGRTGAAATLGIPHVGARGMTVGTWAVPRGMRAPDRTATIPMHALAAGKCFLACLPEAELERWLAAPLAPVTACTITDPDVLCREIEIARERGYATHHGECLEGFGGVAVPILGAGGRVAGVLQLSAPVDWVTEMRVQEWVPMLQPASQAIADALAAATPRDRE